MSQNYCITKKQRFKHLTERERYQIEILLKEKKSPTEISKALGYHKRTIERETARGTVRLLTSELEYRDVYCADTSQRKYEENGTHKGAGLKIGNDRQFARHIENRIIKDRYSPDAVIGEIGLKGLKFKTSICTKTLYNYINKGVFINLTNKDLPLKRTKKKGIYRKVRIAYKNLKGTSIEERPKHIETREEYGHWEMDCVVGGKGSSKATLLVLSERKTRQEIIRKMPDKTQQSVLEELDGLEREYGKEFNTIFRSLTMDNGNEFLDFESLEKERTVLNKGFSFV